MFAAVRRAGEARSATWPEFRPHCRDYAAAKAKPFTHIVVDEAQDLGVAELRFLRPSRRAGPTRCFSPATWASGSSSSRFPGRNSVSTFAAGPLP